MAHTKAKGTTKLGRDSESQRLGVKIFGGSPIKCGQIIIRQRGTRHMAGEGVKIGKDDTIYAIRDGVVAFRKTRYTNFTGNKQIKQIVSVVPATEIKSKVKSEKVKAETTVAPNNNQFNPKEFQEKQEKEPRREEIREQELPKIPMRKDRKKVKSKTKNV